MAEFLLTILITPNQSSFSFVFQMLITELGYKKLFTYSAEGIRLFGVKLSEINDLVLEFFIKLLPARTEENLPVIHSTVAQLNERLNQRVNSELSKLHAARGSAAKADGAKFFTINNILSEYYNEYLILGVLQGDVGVVTDMLKANASIYEENSVGYSAIELAFGLTRKNFFTLMLKYSNEEPDDGVIFNYSL